VGEDGEDGGEAEMFSVFFLSAFVIAGSGLAVWDAWDYAREETEGYRERKELDTDYCCSHHLMKNVAWWPDMAAMLFVVVTIPIPSTGSM